MKIRYTYSGGGDYEPDLDAIAESIGTDATDDEIADAIRRDFDQWVAHGDTALVETDVAITKGDIAKVRAAKDREVHP